MSEYPGDWFRDTPDQGKKKPDDPGTGEPTMGLPLASGRKAGASGQPTVPPTAPPPRPRSGDRSPAGARTSRPKPPSGQPPSAHRPNGQPPNGQPPNGQSPNGQPAGGWPQQPPRSAAGARAGAPGARPALAGRAARGAGRTARPPRSPVDGRPLSPGGYRSTSAPGDGGPATPGGAGGTGGWRRWVRPRRIFTGLAVLIVLILVGTVITYVTLNGKLDKRNVLVDYAGRPAQGSGTTWLIAGSDSRQGLTRKQEERLSTGVGIGGHRSDTILVLHVPSGGGKPVLISLPRDSWVNIPGYGENKINAAYDFGGPKLLAKTVEENTGLRVDHYMQIGFGGFVSVVNAVGGVRMYIKYPLHDVASGLSIKKGWHTLSGAKALAYVRDRHNFGGQDLQRVQDQRLLLKALLAKLTSPGVLLNPFAVIPAADGAASTLTVDKGTSLFQLAHVAFALRHPETTTVPIGNPNFVTPTGEDAVQWDRTEALEMFNALNAGKPVPKGLLTGSKQAS
jgi:LCP family protein required for cell wall assembly